MLTTSLRSSKQLSIYRPSVCTDLSIFRPKYLFFSQCLGSEQEGLRQLKDSSEV